MAEIVDGWIIRSTFSSFLVSLPINKICDGGEAFLEDKL